MVKSPPLERTRPGYSLFKARWRRRWFVLQLGKFPSQYLLQYYTDETKRRLKGTISLDDVEQVDIGLEDGNGKYDHMFNIKTPGRCYFLAVDTCEEMNTWVRMVCNACGLQATQDEDGTYNMSQQQQQQAQQQQENQQPTISSPYILISDCYTGKPVPQPQPRRNSVSATQNSTVASKTKTRTSSASGVTGSPGSPGLRSEVGDDSVFEDSLTATVIVTRGATAQTLAAQLEASRSRPNQSDEITVPSLRHQPDSNLVVLPPGRPPKPPHLVIAGASGIIPAPNGDNYANSQDMQDLYRDAAKEQNNNGNAENNNSTTKDQPIPPVSRNLKPRRKGFSPSGAATIDPSRFSRSTSLTPSSSNRPNFDTLGPPVERALKPKKTGIHGRSRTMSSSSSSHIKGHNKQLRLFQSRGTMNDFSSDDGSNSESGSRRNSDDEEQIYYYMPPVNTATGTPGGNNTVIMIPAKNYDKATLAYIDLDLPKTEDDVFSPPGLQASSKFRPQKPSEVASTIYKTVDFEKTEAFNRTKREIETERQKSEVAGGQHKK